MHSKNHKTTAVILSAGKGKRMNSSVHKQYILLNDKPVIYYSLKAFEDSFIDNIVLVVGKGEQEYCQKELVDKYSFKKVTDIVEGGKERYHSVANGLNAINWECDYVFIHDGARPFVDGEMLKRAYYGVVRHRACVVGMPVKDTVKLADENAMVESTPPRSRVWQVQTPQVFEKNLICGCYDELIANENTLLEKSVSITDDAMVVEYFGHIPVKLVEGSYKNIKITTFEDLGIAKSLIM